MKLEIGDIDEIMEQISRLAPPSQKEDHKFLNLLRKAIEKNVVVKPGPNIEKLAEKNDQKDFKVLSLALMRKDLPIKAQEVFEDHIKQTKEKIEGLGMREAVQERRASYKKRVERCNIPEEIAKIQESVPSIQEKIRKAQSLIEEMSRKSLGKNLKPLEYAENFFRLI
ncbi:uncharacterized protein Eint_060060 [Encephalitozoon intestinalis ATCC 50506]|uniref:Uncharacterized protein n=1 Tax=Encephalitozoon intestinalis (strain ATCC 50506) TaxID=876142 RepID=E0S7D6_ENCIT|nr:uncharacterized protein Eint_060060 [Encephalitozoon intestinalis ATCC 50506]ADM11615.1 hypothetical protein Eint_060060 [Encephalitozoon intestinalis ATCC 50506]UTX45344.1 hypothetical protein GPK93_06g08950 [Encephalitozoon intestinalis]